jgi:CyaY protein
MALNNLSGNPAVNLTETEFHTLVDALLLEIDTAITNQSDSIDTELASGILTLESDLGKIIINRQTPTREIWVAAKSGGFHFRFNGQKWFDTRDGMSLKDRLHEALRELGDTAIRLS